MHHWTVQAGDKTHEIVFEDRKVSGNVKLRIDGTLKEYQTVFVEQAGTLCPFDIDGSELILKLLDNTPMDLIQDGIYLETGLPVEPEVVDGYRSALQAPYKELPAKNKAAMASFLTFVILTYVNIALGIIGTGLNFPFSAIIPQILIELAWYPSDFSLAVPAGILIFAAFLIASVYLALYLLSRKRDWPIMTALILIIIDTVVLLFLSIGNFADLIIDILFHIWVLTSMIKLYTTRRKIKESNLNHLIMS